MFPEVDFSSYSFVPDNIKVKKIVRVRPLPLELGASLNYNLEHRALTYKLACKETVLGGKVTLDVKERAVEYRKRFSLPIVRLDCLVLGARAVLCRHTNRVQTSCRVGFELRQGTAEITKVNTVRVKPQLFFKNIGLEAVTDISFQVPKHLFFELPSDLRRFPNIRSLRSRDGHSGSGPAPPLRTAAEAAAEGTAAAAPARHPVSTRSRSFSAAGAHGSGGLDDAGDADAWGVTLDMQEINLIIRL